MITRTVVFAGLLIGSILILAGCSPQQDELHGAAGRIAQAYGINRFTDLGEIRFTYNDSTAAETTHRHWNWEPETDRVVYTGIGPDGDSIKYEYFRNQMKTGDTTLNKTLDKWFVNDQYWLFFPFHLAWDSHIKIKGDSITPLPIPPGESQAFTVTYSKDAPHMPGVVVQVFYTPEYAITQWIYRKGGVGGTARVTTWEDYVRLGPVTLSLDHEGKDGEFRQWFTDVAAKYQGGGEWFEPTRISPQTTVFGYSEGENNLHH